MTNVEVDRSAQSPDAESLDGVLVLGDLLSRGLSVEVLPRQVLIARDDQENSFSFVHGLPGDSGLAPVTYAQDKRMRRAMMEREGICVPKGATFSVGRGRKLAKKFANRIGYPVTIKPAVGDNAIEANLDIMNDDEFDEALDKLMVPPEDRPGFTRASYGLTELREPGVVDGIITVPPGYEFIVEKQPPGQYVRFFVLDGEMKNAVLCTGSPSDNSLSSVEDITLLIGQALQRKVEDAGSLISGLRAITLDAMVTDLGSEVADAEFVELSERPGFWVHREADEALARHLSHEMVSAYLGSTASPVRGPDQVSYDFDAHAVPDVELAHRMITEIAPDFNIAYVPASSDHVSGTLSGTLMGDPYQVADFVDALLDGRIGSVPVMLCVLTPAEAES